jgi:hypothetical protein
MKSACSDSAIQTKERILSELANELGYTLTPAAHTSREKCHMARVDVLARLLGAEPSECH